MPDVSHVRTMAAAWANSEPGLEPHEEAKLADRNEMSWNAKLADDIMECTHAGANCTPPSNQEQCK